MDKVIIDLNKITFRYGKKFIFSKCSASLYENSITAVLGPNGEGKTTLIKCILNYLHLSEGDIVVCGKKLSAYSIQDLARVISYVPQSNTIVNDIIVRDYIVEGRTPYLGMFSSPKVSDYLMAENVSEKLGISSILGDNIQHLSGGQLQLVMIARALVQDTPIIIMDALSRKGQNEVWINEKTFYV